MESRKYSDLIKQSDGQGSSGDFLQPPRKLGKFLSTEANLDANKPTKALAIGPSQTIDIDIDSDTNEDSNTEDALFMLYSEQNQKRKQQERHNKIEVSGVSYLL
ncbi:uncharacterized protein BDCG_06316 [Blastomyces dermatitidis ER-3]|uniref:Uncharacterized protein n=1 Tax=Ajellomyces dermatitidis (strain ER-3 / ATCC MYA-2586) TaxID=559297 RepID=A0ABP2F4Y0_AJEDR|nr:uncharacterized protein BDCG_06316 [Blastomyces dermatitidis ER-3]EEQ91196.1 hypothetical protein BDCG_06316 [Blastomyces dermatitidis ER-3]